MKGKQSQQYRQPQVNNFQLTDSNKNNGNNNSGSLAAFASIQQQRTGSRLNKGAVGKTNSSHNHYKTTVGAATFEHIPGKVVVSGPSPSLKLTDPRELYKINQNGTNMQTKNNFKQLPASSSSDHQPTTTKKNLASRYQERGASNNNSNTIATIEQHRNTTTTKQPQKPGTISRNSIIFGVSSIDSEKMKQLKNDIISTANINNSNQETHTSIQQRLRSLRTTPKNNEDSNNLFSSLRNNFSPSHQNDHINHTNSSVNTKNIIEAQRNINAFSDRTRTPTSSVIQQLLSNQSNKKSELEQYNKKESSEFSPVDNKPPSQLNVRTSHLRIRPNKIIQNEELDYHHKQHQHHNLNTAGNSRRRINYNKPQNNNLLPPTAPQVSSSKMAVAVQNNNQMISTKKVIDSNGNMLVLATDNNTVTTNNNPPTILTPVKSGVRYTHLKQSNHQFMLTNTQQKPQIKATTGAVAASNNAAPMQISTVYSISDHKQAGINETIVTPTASAGANNTTNSMTHRQMVKLRSNTTRGNNSNNNGSNNNTYRQKLQLQQTLTQQSKFDDQALVEADDEILRTPSMFHHQNADYEENIDNLQDPVLQKYVSQDPDYQKGKINGDTPQVTVKRIVSKYECLSEINVGLGGGIGSTNKTTVLQKIPSQVMMVKKRARAQQQQQQCNLSDTQGGSPLSILKHQQNAGAPEQANNHGEHHNNNYNSQAIQDSPEQTVHHQYNSAQLVSTSVPQLFKGKGSQQAGQPTSTTQQNNHSGMSNGCFYPFNVQAQNNNNNNNLDPSSTKSNRSISLHKRISSHLVNNNPLQNCQIQGKKINIDIDRATSQAKNEQQFATQDSARGSKAAQKSQRSLRSNKSNKSAKGGGSKHSIISKMEKQLINIKIVNSEKQVVQTFVAEKNLIVSQMKYFSKSLNSQPVVVQKQNFLEGESGDIIDIQVCCDAKIFKFLLDYCTQLHEQGYVSSASSAQLTEKLLFPVLVSSVFLQIETLIQECIRFWSRRFQIIMRGERIPVSQLEARILTKLCEAIKLEKVLVLEHENQLSKEQQNGQNSSKVSITREKINLNQEMMEKMYMHYTLRLLDDESFATCQFCYEIYPSAHANKLKCSATHHFFVDNSEQRIQMHVADRQLDLKRFSEYLNEQVKLSWKQIFAKVLARSIILPNCSVCLDKTSAAFLQSCNSHLQEPSFTLGAHIGVYPCCGQHVIRAAYDQHQGEISRNTKNQKSKNGQHHHVQSNQQHAQHSNESKQCELPIGCHLQDHSINWRKFGEYEMDLLDFLRLKDIEPHAFEKRHQIQSLTSKATSASQPTNDSLASFASQIQNYKNDMITLVNDALTPSYPGGDHQFTNEIPPELNKQLHDGMSPSNPNMMSFAFGGILEQFEDDIYGSDEEDYQLQKQFWQEQLKNNKGNHKVKAANDQKTSMYGQDEFSKIGGSSTQATCVNNKVVVETKPLSIEEALLAQWNVTSSTRKKVRLSGKEVYYTFKFSMSGKQQEAGKNYMKDRDERLRNQAEHPQSKEQMKIAQSLAIPSNKELFVQKGDYKEFSKGNIKGEKKFRQQNFDQLRIEQLTNSLTAMRKIEKSKEQILDQQEVKTKKTAKEVLIQQQKITVNRLSTHKDVPNKPSQLFQEQSASGGVTAVASPVLQTTTIYQPNDKIVNSHSNIININSNTNNMNNTGSSNIASLSNTMISLNQQQQQTSSQTKRRDNFFANCQSPSKTTPIQVQSMNYMISPSKNSVNNQTSTQPQQQILGPSQFQQKVITPNTMFQPVMPSQSNNNINVLQRVNKALQQPAQQKIQPLQINTGQASSPPATQALVTPQRQLTLSIVQPPQSPSAIGSRGGGVGNTATVNSKTAAMSIQKIHSKQNHLLEDTYGRGSLLKSTILPSPMLFKTNSNSNNAAAAATFATPNSNGPHSINTMNRTEYNNQTSGSKIGDGLMVRDFGQPSVLTKQNSVQQPTYPSSPKYPQSPLVKKKGSTSFNKAVTTTSPPSAQATANTMTQSALKLSLRSPNSNRLTRN